MNMCPIPNGFRDRVIWPETNCSLTYWMLSSAKRNVKTHSDEQHAMSSHDLQSALMLTVEFSNIYYKLYQLCHLNNKYRY